MTFAAGKYIGDQRMTNATSSGMREARKFKNQLIFITFGIINNNSFRFSHKFIGRTFKIPDERTEGIEN